VIQTYLFFNEIYEPKMKIWWRFY